jgi:hypothetical protein
MGQQTSGIKKDNNIQTGLKDIFCLSEEKVKRK